jgi:hypothetical protein
MKVTFGAASGGTATANEGKQGRQQQETEENFQRTMRDRPNHRDMIAGVPRVQSRRSPQFAERFLHLPVVSAENSGPEPSRSS